MSQFRKVVHVEGNCWEVKFFENCKLRRICFLCDVNPSGMSLAEILTYPPLTEEAENFSYKQALVEIGSPVPSKARQQKKLFRRITDDDKTPEEHF